MSGNKVVLLMLVVSPLLGACDGGVDLDGTLDDAEAAALGEALFQSTWDNNEDQSQQPGLALGPAAVPFSFSSDIEVTGAACPLGGTVDLSGTLDISGDTETSVTTVEVSETQVHHDCQVQAESNDQVFTLNGSPNVMTEITITTDDSGGFEFDGSMSGNIQWETEGRAGVCALAVEFSGSGNEGTGSGSFSMTGTVCSATVTHEATIG